MEPRGSAPRPRGRFALSGGENLVAPYIGSRCENLSPPLPYSAADGAWRSLVARVLWEHEVPGSNPGAPTFMSHEEVPVLIVGGSLVGLTTAMLLGHHGVPSLSVERHAGSAIHPRAGHFQLRTMELLRQLGLEERVRAKSLETYSPTGGIVAVESLAGRELAT